MNFTTSHQIKALLAPPDAELSAKATLELLDDRLKTIDNLRDLEVVVDEAQKHHDTLKSKLATSQANVDTMITATRESAAAHLHTAQELSLVRHSLADELADINEDLVPHFSDDGERTSTLLEDIQSLHRDLDELSNLKEYVLVIERTVKLSDASAQQTRDLPLTQPISISSISQYRALHDFVDQVAELCSTAADSTGNKTLYLVSFLRTLRERTWQNIRDILAERLLSAAETLQWPRPVEYHTASLEHRQAFEHAFINLLRLQDLARKVISSEDSVREGLYPIQALVRPISLRFKYHFEGSRDTNKLDKPEWYFTHVLNVAHEHRPFMNTIVQTLLSSEKIQGISAWDEFTSLLLPILAKKLRRTVPVLLPHPSLLAHTIYQALAFDAALRDEGFQISLSTSAKHEPDEDRWEGISEIILGQKDWFEAWVDGENKFTEQQYNEIISSPDAWQIADDGADDKSRHIDLKTTNSARQLKALVEQVTDRYSPLPDFAQRTRFLISVQLPLLEHYLGRIASSLDAFESYSSVFSRAVPGALGVALGTGDGGVKMDTNSLTSGVEGAQRLCKALLSAKYIESAMEAWGEELFFLELWAEINRRASLRARATENPNLPDPHANELEVPQDTIFEELVLRYKKVADRAQSMIVQQVCAEIDHGLKAHFVVTTSRNPEERADEIALSQTLLGPVALLSSYLTYLRSLLSEAMLTTIYRNIATHLAEHILNRGILYRGRFDLSAAKAISAECALWVETCHAGVRGTMSRSRVEAPWLGLLQAARIVSTEGHVWEELTNAAFEAGDAWRETTSKVVGVNQLSREEVQRILRCRQDCPK
ncbi:RAD50-interacting protein 1 [Pleurotus pulmonarius]